jgi:hypothetical protein
MGRHGSKGMSAKLASQIKFDCKKKSFASLRAKKRWMN